MTVWVKLDESLVFRCAAHPSCSYNGRGPVPDSCTLIWIYGVGAAVYELDEDLNSVRERLGRLKARLLSRENMQFTRRYQKFSKKGWHATEDGPEFSVPFVSELDDGAGFKGHIRYAVVDRVLTSTEQIETYDTLFAHLLRALGSRYRDSPIDLVFERDESSASRYDEIVRRAGLEFEDVSYADESKGDPAIAVADYLLYAALNFVAESIAVCVQSRCMQRHDVPIAATLTFDSRGRAHLPGHLDAQSRYYRLYTTFVRHMSSAVRV